MYLPWIIIQDQIDKITKTYVLGPPIKKVFIINFYKIKKPYILTKMPYIALSFIFLGHYFLVNYLTQSAMVLFDIGESDLYQDGVHDFVLCAIAAFIVLVYMWVLLD